MTTPLTDLNNNHINFSVAGESRTLAELFAGFGIDMPTTDRAAELRELCDQVTTFARPYRHNTTEALADQFQTTTPDKWEELLDAAAIEQVKAQIVRDIFPGWGAELREQINATKADATAYAEYIGALDTAEAINTMTVAGRALRGAHHNASRAIDVDPVAFRNFRDAGRKLARLPRLLRFDGLAYNPGRNPELLVALYANPGDLPELKASPTRRLGVHEAHYTDTDSAIHNQVVEARELVRSRGKENLFLAELATGRWPALTFNIAPTITELKRRALIIAEAGVINYV